MVMCGYLQGAGVEFHWRTTGPLRDVPPSSLPEGGCQTLDANHYRLLGVTECGHRHVGHCQGLCGRNRWRRYFCTYNKSTIEYSCIFFHTNKKKSSSRRDGTCRRLGCPSTKIPARVCATPALPWPHTQRPCAQTIFPTELNTQNHP